jgi:hypothetical protein
LLSEGQFSIWKVQLLCHEVRHVWISSPSSKADFIALFFVFSIYWLQITIQITKRIFGKLEQQLFDLEFKKKLRFLSIISQLMQMRSITRQTKKSRCHGSPKQPITMQLSQKILNHIHQKEEILDEILSEFCT